jgi:hypothetical protein
MSSFVSARAAATVIISEADQVMPALPKDA